MIEDVAEFKPAVRQAGAQARGLHEKWFALRRFSLFAEQPAQLQAGVKIIRS